MIVKTQTGPLSNAPLLCYRNLARTALISSAASFDAGFPAGNIGTYETWQAARITTPGFTIINIDFGASQSFDYIGLGGIVTAGAAVISIVDSSSFFPYDTLDAVALGDGLRLILHDTVTASSILVALSNVKAVSNIMLGLRTPLERNIYVGHSPANLSRQTELVGAQSANGQYLGRAIRSRSVATQVSLSNLTPGWYRSTFDPFVEAAQLQPFYWGWRPNTYSEAVYGWLRGDVRPSNQRTNGMMSVSFDIEGRAR